MTPILTEFLRDYLQWSSGQESHHTYDTKLGLCGLLVDYMKDPDSEFAINRELRDLWSVGNLDKLFPFGLENYRRRYANRTQHLCPIRRVWIMQQLHLLPKRWFGRHTDTHFKVRVWYAFGRIVHKKVL